MRRVALIVFFLSAHLAHGAEESSAVSARRARALLGDSIWSRIVTIENRGRDRTYPRCVHALIFELLGRLWFYTDVNGTQSLSVYRDHLAADKVDFSALLRAIEPGFVRYVIDPPAPPDKPEFGQSLPRDAPLPNGCFVESVAAWLQRQARGERVLNPALFSYYELVAGTSDLHGHTVLAYDTPQGVAIDDPDLPRRMILAGARADRSPAELAKEFTGHAVAKVVILPLSVPERGHLAAQPAASAGTPAAAL